MNADADTQVGGPLVGLSRNPFLPLAPPSGQVFLDNLARRLSAFTRDSAAREIEEGVQRWAEVLGKRVEVGDEGEGKGVEREADREVGARGVGVCA